MIGNQLTPNKFGAYLQNKKCVFIYICQLIRNRQYFRIDGKHLLVQNTTVLKERPFNLKGGGAQGVGASEKEKKNTI